MDSRSSKNSNDFRMRSSGSVTAPANLARSFGDCGNDWDPSAILEAAARTEVHAKASGDQVFQKWQTLAVLRQRVQIQSPLEASFTLAGIGKDFAVVIKDK